MYIFIYLFILIISMYLLVSQIESARLSSPPRAGLRTYYIHIICIYIYMCLFIIIVIYMYIYVHILISISSPPRAGLRRMSPQSAEYTQ